MKVCSLYGAGFYYMPGTDICIKIGGYVRAQYYAWGGASGTGNAYTGSAVFDTRTGGNQDFIFRVRTLISTDTRQQTEYGTLRTYMNIGWTHDTAGSSSIYVNRAFIQLAGFTFGKAQSFFDIFSPASVSYFAWPSHDTGDGGVNLAAYTAQFGNGFTGTIAIEDARRTALIDSSLGVPTVGVVTTDPGTLFVPGALPSTAYGNFNMPDIVANLRVDQAWGSAQVMGAVHQVRAGYYGASEVAGHPTDEYGWAVGAGLNLNASFISPGDRFQISATYTEGALRYLAATQFGSSYARFSGDSVGLGWVADGTFTGTNPLNGTGIDLTKGWAVTASYDHIWSQKWKTSLYGGLLAVDYSDTSSARICQQSARTTGSFAPNVTTVTGTLSYGAGCDADWGTWWIGSRTQFNINASTYMGVDIMYTKLDSMEGTTATFAGSRPDGAKPAATYFLADQDNLSVTFRVHRDFLP